MMYKYNEENNVFIQYNEQDEFQLPQIVWHITNDCTLDCIYCFSDKTNFEVDIKDLDIYISKFKFLNIQKIDISGGEPLLFKNIDILCERLIKEGFKITITTMGIGVKKNIDWLIRNCKKFSRIILSVDIWNSNLQDFICNGRSVLEYINKLYNSLSESKYENLRINTVATKYLLDNRELKNLIEYISSLKIIEWCIVEFFSIKNKANNSDYFLFGDAFKGLLREINKYDLNKIKLIYRCSEDYYGYWVLNPDGEIMQRSYFTSENIRFSLKETDNNEIRKRMREGFINFPGKR